MEKNVLIMSDFVGFGDVALATARSILTGMGCHVFCLPTAILSNTWNYGNCAVLDTTDYMRSAMETWNTLAFPFDAVLIGYVANEKQVRWIEEQCKRWHAGGIRILLDPLFADHGKLYHGISPKQIDLLRVLMGYADDILPNVTEAQFLAGVPVQKPVLSRWELDSIVFEMAKWTSGRILVTGANVGSEQAVAAWDGQQVHLFPYESIPGSFSGTGDVFAALFLGACLKGMALADAVLYAITQTRFYLQQMVNCGWQGTGIPVERFF